MNCFDCELAKSCHHCFKKIAQIKSHSTDINKTKQLPPDENRYMLPHYVGQDTQANVQTEEVRSEYRGCGKCFVEMNHDNYIKNGKLCRWCYNQNRRK